MDLFVVLNQPSPSPSPSRKRRPIAEHMVSFVSASEVELKTCRSREGKKASSHLSNRSLGGTAFCAGGNVVRGVEPK